MAFTSVCHVVLWKYLAVYFLTYLKGKVIRDREREGVIPWVWLLSDSTYQWVHAVFVFSCLAYFTQCKVIQVHSCCCKYKISFPKAGLYSISSLFIHQKHVALSILWLWEIVLLPTDVSHLLDQEQHSSKCIWEHHSNKIYICLHLKDSTRTDFWLFKGSDDERDTPYQHKHTCRILNS